MIPIFPMLSGKRFLLLVQHNTLGVVKFGSGHCNLDDVLRKGRLFFGRDPPGLSFKRGEENVAHRREKEYF